MNQEKIGKFIAKCRKKQKLTQAELGEKLGFTEKSISNWENGRNMPGLSLFKPLCAELDITVNDLLSGEKVANDQYQEKFEENIVKTINYSTKRITKYNQILAIIIMIFGLFITITAVIIFPSESSWSSIYSLFGILIFMIGIFLILKSFKWYFRLLLTLAIFITSIGILFFTDYLNVKFNDQAPMFRIKTIFIGDVTFYDTLFYDVYRCNCKSLTGYCWTIQKNKDYNNEYLLNYCKK